MTPILVGFSAANQRNRTLGRDFCGRHLTGREAAGFGEYDGKGTAATRRALDVEPRLMAAEHVLDDSEAKAGAAGFTRTAAVHAIAAFGEPVDVLRLDADAGVGPGEGRLGIVQPPAYFDLAVFRRVAQGVADQ